MRSDRAETLIDVRASLAATAKRDVTFDAPGTYVLALATDNRAYSRQVDDFERYSRAAKSIVLVGASSVQSQAHVTKPLGLPLEIVPVVNPYSEPRPTSFRSASFTRARSARRAREALSTSNRISRQSTRDAATTQGLATFPMPSDRQLAGQRRLDKRLENSPEADFETVFASLTFGSAEK